MVGEHRRKNLGNPQKGNGFREARGSVDVHSPVHFVSKSAQIKKCTFELDVWLKKKVRRAGPLDPITTELNKK